MTTTATTCPWCSGRVRRRLTAFGHLLVRLALIYAAAIAFLLFRQPFSQFMGWLVAAVMAGAAGHAAFRSFRRAWITPGRRSPRQVTPDVLHGPPLVPIAVDRDGTARYRSTPHGGGGRT